MKSKMNLLSKGALLALLLGLFSIPLLAQHNHEGKKEGIINVGKRGEVTFTSPTRVGDTVLKSGNYVLQHRAEGEDHVVIFQESGKEVARVKCTLETLGEKAKRTAFQTRAGEGGETVLVAIEVKGENIRHVI